MSEAAECPTCGREAVYHPQCGYAMAKLCERLLAQGYVVDDKTHDLRERAANLQCGRGFLLNADVLSAPTSTEDLLS